MLGTYNKISDTINLIGFTLSFVKISIKKGGASAPEILYIEHIEQHR